MIITFRPESLDQALKVMGSPSNADTLRQLTQLAKSNGAIRHEFFADREAGTLVAIDEWESPEAFQAFFGDNPDIRDLMEQSGVRTPPEVRVLVTTDIPGSI
jgi:quinol monooxygenase YgiN